MTTSKLDAIAARLEAIGAGVEISGSQLAVLMDDAEQLLEAVRNMAALAEEWRYKGEFGWGAWQEGEGPDPEGWALDIAAGKIRDALAPLTEGEANV